MIDEDLYQRAADELNSERRRPHIWARACALANDDHDEARYLYTNLRVEEMLAEGPGNKTRADATDVTDMEPAELSLSLELEPVRFEGEDGDGDDAISSVRAGSDTRTESLLPGARDEGTLRPVSVHGRSVLEFDTEDALDLDSDDLRRRDEAAEDAVPAIDERLLPDGDDVDGDIESDIESEKQKEARERDAFLASLDDVRDEPHGDADAGGALVARMDGSTDTDRAEDVDRSLLVDMESPAGVAPSSGALDDLDWLDEAYREERRALAATPPASADEDDDPDELTRELRRQAEELPGGRGESAVIAYEGEVVVERATPEADPAADRFDHPDREGRIATDDPVAEVATGTVADVSADTRSADIDEPVEFDEPPEFDEPLELVDEGAGDEEYAVFARPEGDSYQMVRQGGSWAAMLLTLPWLLYRRLIGTALIYALLAVIIVAGLLLTGFAWQEAGSDATLVTRAAAIGFVLLALAGLFVVPFRSANHWREDKLEHRGFELVAYVRARNAKRALELFRQARDGARDEAS